jgi:hypothetical protein
MATSEFHFVSSPGDPFAADRFSVKIFSGLNVHRTIGILVRSTEGAQSPNRRWAGGSMMP